MNDRKALIYICKKIKKNKKCIHIIVRLSLLLSGKPPLNLLSFRYLHHKGKMFSINHYINNISQKKHEDDFSYKDWSVGILKIDGGRFPDRLLKLRSLKFIYQNCNSIIEKLA